MERRSFIQRGSLAAFATAAGLAKGEEKASAQGDWPIIVFEKPFQRLPYDRIGEEMTKLGLQGIEATIRKGGHIKQEEAEDKVPQMVADLAKNGQKALIAATHVLQASNETETFLRILKANGIERYRMNYYRYDLKRDLLSQVREHRQKAQELAALNKEVGIQGVYQQHSGAKLLGGMSWDLALLLEGIDPAHLGVAFDLRHSRTDSGLSWRTSLQVLRPHLQSIYIKDAKWVGEKSDKLKPCSLGTGFVRKKDLADARSGQPPMPLSLHMEWGIHKLYPKESVSDALRRVGIDAHTLKSWL